MTIGNSFFLRVIEARNGKWNVASRSLWSVKTAPQSSYSLGLQGALILLLHKSPAQSCTLSLSCRVHCRPQLLRVVSMESSDIGVPSTPRNSQLTLYDTVPKYERRYSADFRKESHAATRPTPHYGNASCWQQKFA